MSVAVGFTALAGVVTETNVLMLIYLDQALVARRARCSHENRAFTRTDLHAAIMEGTVEQVRPNMMTVSPMSCCALLSR